MSRNALALVDCNSRDTLFQFLAEAIDRKVVKNEMVSPYDDQLIGKMNFRYGDMEHSMFFTYARSSEYPGMRFRNHRILYLSLGVNSTSSAIFEQICSRFGGYIDYDDDLDNGWQKIERQKLEEEIWAEEVAEQTEPKKAPANEQQEVRQILKLEQKPERPAGEQKEPREPKEQKERRRDNRPDRRPDQRRNEKGERRGNPRHERKEQPKDPSRGEHRQNNRPRGEKPANRKPEQKHSEKQDKPAGNGSQN